MVRRGDVGEKGSGVTKHRVEKISVTVVVLGGRRVSCSVNMVKEDVGLK